MSTQNFGQAQHVLTPLQLKIIIDYSLTLEQMIVAGQYDWKNDNITAERFPVKGSGKVERVPHLVHFNRDFSSEYAVEELDKDGKRPGTIKELLAFGATYPDMQKKFPIVALGSSCLVSGNRSVACLFRCDSLRCLILDYWHHDWGDDVRVLAFDKDLGA